MIYQDYGITLTNLKVNSLMLLRKSYRMTFWTGQNALNICCNFKEIDLNDWSYLQIYKAIDTSHPRWFSFGHYLITQSLFLSDANDVLLVENWSCCSFMNHAITWDQFLSMPLRLQMELSNIRRRVMDVFSQNYHRSFENGTDSIVD